MNLTQAIEALLFVSPRPLSLKKIALCTNASLAKVASALDELEKSYNSPDRGIVLVRHADRVQCATHPDTSSLIQSFLKEEVSGELSRAASETLAVIAYRGPIRKAQIEEIRGVNCSIALRNLLVRGLIEARSAPDGEKEYVLHIDFLRHLGLRRVSELPDYEALQRVAVEHETV